MALSPTGLVEAIGADWRGFPSRKIHVDFPEMVKEIKQPSSKSIEIVVYEYDSTHYQLIGLREKLQENPTAIV